MKTFYILIDSGVSYYYFTRFGGKYFADKGWQVKYIDTTYLTRKGSINLMKYENFTYENTEVMIAKSFKDIEAALNKDSIGVAILSLVANGLYEFKMKDMLRKNNIKFGMDKLGLKYYDFISKISVDSVKRNIVRKVYDSLEKNGLKKTFSLILLVFYQKFIYKDMYDFVLTIDKKRLMKYESNFFVNDFIECHSWDYDEYLNIQNHEMVKKNYVLFLDQNLPNHPEIIEEKLLSMGSKKYYLELNKLFDIIEKSYNTKVLIAGHPTGNIDYAHQMFNGREVILYKTINLIKDAKFVISHHTAALNFALIFKKQILFITNDNFEENVLGSYIKEFALSLGQTLINISKKNEKIELNDINDELYDKYLKNNISKFPTNLTRNWDIFYKNYIKETF